MPKIGIAAFALLSLMAAQLSAQGDATAPPEAKQKARTLAAKPPAVKPKLPVAKAVPLVPLTDRERALQILDRFTFGARPGDLDGVMTLGVDKWFEQQLAPDAIKDASLDRRLADFPTLNMTPEQALTLFPDRGIIQQVADAKRPYPADPLLAAMYEVQVAKLERQNDSRRLDASGNVPPEPTEAEKTALRQAGQANAARIAGELFALPKNHRMAALIKMSVDDRIAFTSFLGGDRKTLLLADFTPHEREIVLGMQSDVGAQYRTGDELAQAKMVRAILSERQLQEVMTDFWFNHFNVYMPKDSDQWYTTSYERDIIRKNALGRFGDLLVGTAQSPAMMVYLDNWLSIGPDSRANGVNLADPKSKPGNKGLNENYGREIMELHTVGVNGGYTQADVTNLAAILTGWSVDRPYQAGAFQFDAKKHEPGTKTWLGHAIGSGPAFMIQGTVPGSVAANGAAPAKSLPDMSMGSTGDMAMGGAPAGPEQKAVALASSPGNAGMKEGLEALDLLARSPQTARFISGKIAQRFVADDPPPALVDRMTKTFLTSDGDIKAVLRTLVSSPEFNSKKYFRNKVKTPMEFLASAFRTSMTDPANPGALVGTIKNMGMPLYKALPPTGYYITADKWMNTSALVDRLNFAYALTNSKFANQKFDAARLLALGLLSDRSPSLMPSASAGTGPRQNKASRATYAEAVIRADTSSMTPAGTDIALKVLESTLIGGEVSSQTNLQIHKQIDKANQQSTSPADMLNLLTALVMGSPEFQSR